MCVYIYISHVFVVAFRAQTPEHRFVLAGMSQCHAVEVMVAPTGPASRGEHAIVSSYGRIVLVDVTHRPASLKLFGALITIAFR